MNILRLLNRFGIQFFVIFVSLRLCRVYLHAETGWIPIAAVGMSSGIAWAIILGIENASARALRS